MKLNKLIGMLTYALMSMAHAEIPSRSIQLQLPNQQHILVSEGELEPRSIGSYAIRLYAGGSSEFPFDVFLSGQIQPRDGSLERVINADINGDGIDEVIIVLRSAGSGGYLSADAFSWQNNQLQLLAAVKDLAPNTELIQAFAQFKIKNK
ncbi:PliI family lysozyme inhibitor of I-type lysozyme [Deefgea piscis]|uniref:PliI family lysozyme inhibitor of I-type lysozyme n=1 Tax=Deefgea piscis TaxID=2739061 RepID=UPI001C809FAF|nr:PliI family lysozyme inhibitor of I-type lysozyme [Deefgea piscis]QZA81586.1 PliI family lysozyme inhibitor of I-type lysozyme [Deefgea piscis]